MFRGGSKVSPKGRKPVAVSTQNPNGLLSPRFKSVAAMAGWDEEALIIATTVVEDTPDRESKNKKRCDLCFKTPPSTASRRKRMSRRNQNQVSPPIATLNLEEEEKEEPREDKGAVNNEEKKTESTLQLPDASLPNQAIPCMDKLREELSCAICLEICFEPSTTPCGHSFCKKCLRSAADKCGKRCPKCRQLISNGRSCTINTVLWNTIKLLFPQEIEARKAGGASPETGISNKNRRRNFRSPSVIPAAMRTRETSRQEANDAALAERLQREDLSRLLRPEGSGRRRRGLTPSQDEDAALALRLQREELVESFIGEAAGSRATTTSISLARANLRAMASRAVMVRPRARPSP